MAKRANPKMTIKRGAKPRRSTIKALPNIRSVGTVKVYKSKKKRK